MLGLGDRAGDGEGGGVGGGGRWGKEGGGMNRLLPTLRQISPNVYFVREVLQSHSRERLGPDTKTRGMCGTINTMIP